MMARSVPVLDVDSGLAARLPPGDAERARRKLLGALYAVAPGPWELREPARGAGLLGLLVADGVLGYRTTLDRRATLELLGPGDLLQPWARLQPGNAAPATGRWEVIEPSRFVLLDRRFAEALVDWPEVMAALMHRLVLRSRRLCYQLAVNASPRVEDRVLYTLWALAERWGRASAEGVTLQTRFTHEQLAELVCATRPSVSAALAQLRDDDRIDYGPDRFVLCGDPPQQVETLKRQVALDE